ncbi:MAG: hypothetical protein ACI88G_000313 [Woeseiaceae bacterium]|jgi:hypothetical protein
MLYATGSISHNLVRDDHVVLSRELIPEDNHLLQLFRVLCGEINKLGWIVGQVKEQPFVIFAKRVAPSTPSICTTSGISKVKLMQRAPRCD